MKRLATSGVPPMKRLIERAEFEKRLADYSTNILKSFKQVLALIDAQQKEIEALKAERKTEVACS